MSKWSPSILPLQHAAATGSHMTRLPGVRDSSEVLPGMAHFPGEGPAGKNCGDCAYRGYYRSSGDGEKTFRTGGCQMFLTLSGRHGPPVKTFWPACKHYKDIAQSTSQG